MREASAILEHLEVYVRVEHLVLLGDARANFQHDGIVLGSILKMMSVGDTGLESRTISGAQYLFPGVCRKNDFALHDKYELVFCGVPVALTRPTTWR